MRREELLRLYWNAYQEPSGEKKPDGKTFLLRDRSDGSHLALPSKAAQGVARSWTRMVGRCKG